MKSVPKRVLHAIFRSQIGPLIALLIVIGLFAALDHFLSQGRFASVRNLRVMLNAASLVAVPALGMTLIIIAGGIDLSAGTALTLCATVLAVCLKFNETLVFQIGDMTVLSTVTIALTLTVLTGLLCGLLNGLVISTMRIVPFIVTLGSMTIFLGVGKIISGESTVYPKREAISAWLKDFCSTGLPDVYFGWIPNIPSSVIVAVILALIVAAVLRYTVFGRNVFAVGSNESTARLCGVNIPLTITLVYMLAGLFVAIGGIYNFANIKNGNPSAGQGLELDIIAAVVLGGGSLSGGRGSVLGTMTGAMIMAVIRSGCDQLSIPNPYQDIIIGLIIIAAVAIDQLRQGSPAWLFRLFPKSELN